MELPNGVTYLTTASLPDIPVMSPPPPSYKGVFTTVCSECEDGIPGVIPTTITMAGAIPPPAATHTHHSITPAPTHVEGFIASAATSYSLPWYRQPWTVPLAYALCLYSIFSAVMLIVLLGKRKIDWKLNYHPRTSSYRRAIYPDDDSSIWRIDSTDYVHINQIRHRRALPLPLISRAGTASIADTEINYSETGGSARDSFDWDRFIDMMMRGQIVSIPVDRDGRHDSEYIIAETAAGVPGMRPRTVMSARDVQDEQMRVWQMHEMARLEERMGRAGWM